MPALYETNLVAVISLLEFTSSMCVVVFSSDVVTIKAIKSPICRCIIPVAKSQMPPIYEDRIKLLLN